jgi:hypothetical protein
MKLTKNFTLEEFLFSQVAYRNSITEQFNPPSEIISNIKKLAVFLQEIRDELKVPIVITSGYRCKRLNDLINGSSTSSHMEGLAADFYSPAIRNGELFKRVRMFLESKNKNFDQLIWEFGNEYDPAWVHLGIEGKLRKQIFSIGVALKL